MAVGFLRCRVPVSRRPAGRHSRQCSRQPSRAATCHRHSFHGATNDRRWRTPALLSLPAGLRPVHVRFTLLATRLSAAQARSAEQKGNTFLSPSQAPRRLSGGERQRGGTNLLGRHEASPEFPRRLSRGPTNIRRAGVRTKRDSSSGALRETREWPGGSSDDLRRPQRSGRPFA